MITEDYVSFEIAKLLKEKEFDVPCIGRYSVRSKEFHLDCTRLCNNGGLFEFSAPTFQMAMKWIREVHKCYIHNVPFYQDLNYSEPPKWLLAVDSKGMPYPTINNHFNTYEEACEAAIKYCLTNLI